MITKPEHSQFEKWYSRTFISMKWHEWTDEQRKRVIEWFENELPKGGDET